MASQKRVGIVDGLRRLAAGLGPGLITAAVVLGPGSITVSSKCGALMGFSALWAVVVASVLMVTYTQMGARIGMASGESLVAAAGQVLGRWAALLLGICAFLIATGFQTGNNVGVGVAMNALLGGAPGLWAAVFTVVALVVLWTTSSLYRALERLMVILVGMMILCFAADLFLVRPPLGAVARGLVPSLPEVPALVVALSATTFSVAAAAFQAYLVQSKGWNREDLQRGMRDVVVGICVLGGISCVIMVTSATVLRPHGIRVDSAADMARQLEPLLGAAARWLFLLGLWAAAFSSFIVNAMVGGTLLADACGLGGGLNDRWPKVLASAVMVFGTAVALVFGSNPIQLLVMAQATTIVGVPFIAFVMLVLANRRERMGNELRNRLAANIVGGIGLAWLVVLSGRQISLFARQLGGG
ncbi:MAG: Nramp family divalent metal transporter [Lentisphaeria bacterium]|nr:Nramp family divalent metal transporter [Lentisphaeria bacterium]